MERKRITSHMDGGIDLLLSFDLSPSVVPHMDMTHNAL